MKKLKLTLLIFFIFLIPAFSQNRVNLFIDISGSMYSDLPEIQKYITDDYLPTLAKDTELKIFKFYGKLRTTPIYEGNLESETKENWAKHQVNELAANGPWTNIMEVFDYIKSNCTDYGDSFIIFTDGKNESEDGVNNFEITDDIIKTKLGKNARLVQKGKWKTVEFVYAKDEPIIIEQPQNVNISVEEKLPEVEDKNEIINIKQTKNFNWKKYIWILPIIILIILLVIVLRKILNSSGGGVPIEVGSSIPKMASVSKGTEIGGREEGQADIMEKGSENMSDVEQKKPMQTYYDNYREEAEECVKNHPEDVKELEKITNKIKNGELTLEEANKYADKYWHVLHWSRKWHLPKETNMPESDKKKAVHNNMNDSLHEKHPEKYKKTYYYENGKPRSAYEPNLGVMAERDTAKRENNITNKNAIREADKEKLSRSLTYDAIHNPDKLKEEGFADFDIAYLQRFGPTHNKLLPYDTTEHHSLNGKQQLVSNTVHKRTNLPHNGSLANNFK